MYMINVDNKNVYKTKGDKTMNILLQTLEKRNDGIFYEPLGSNNQMIINIGNLKARHLI